MNTSVSFILSGGKLSFPPTVNFPQIKFGSALRTVSLNVLYFTARFYLPS